MREKLIELLSQVQYLGGLEEKIADHLVANGVTIATDNNVGDKKLRFLLRENGDIIPLTNCPQWIPVTERLPEHGEIVLAFGKRHATSGMFRGTSPTKPNWWHWKGNMYKEVSHWMPLPEPPKGE